MTRRDAFRLAAGAAASTVAENAALAKADEILSGDAKRIPWSDWERMSAFCCAGDGFHLESRCVRIGEWFCQVSMVAVKQTRFEIMQNDGTTKILDLPEAACITISGRATRKEVSLMTLSAYRENLEAAIDLAETFAFDPVKMWTDQPYPSNHIDLMEFSGQA